MSRLLARKNQGLLIGFIFIEVILPEKVDKFLNREAVFFHNFSLAVLVQIFHSCAVTVSRQRADSVAISA